MFGLNGYKFNDLTSAVLSIIGLFNPLKEILSGGNQGFADWEKLGQMLNSLGSMIGSEAVNIVLEYTTLKVE